MYFLIHEIRIRLGTNFSQVLNPVWLTAQFVGGFRARILVIKSSRDTSNEASSVPFRIFISAEKLQKVDRKEQRGNTPADNGASATRRTG